MKSEDLLSIQDVAEIFDVTPVTVQHWVQKGDLAPALPTHPPNFRPRDIHAFYDRRQDRAAGRKRILIVEDDPLVGNSLRNLLEKEGCETALMPIGLAALDLISAQNFDLIISDIRMPGMNGIQTLRAIRELHAQFGRTAPPQIVLTAYDEEAVRKEAERMGVAEFMLKPFEVNEFLAAVGRHLPSATTATPPSTTTASPPSATTASPPSVTTVSPPAASDTSPSR